MQRNYSKRERGRSKPRPLDSVLALGCGEPQPGNLLPAEAVHNAALDPEVVLACTAEVRIEVVKLCGTQRNVLGERDVRSAAEGHGKRVVRSRAEPGDRA